MITDSDRSHIHCVAYEQSALWWCELNDGEWPDVFPDPEPIEDCNGTGRRIDLMNEIMNWVGGKLINYTWNCVHQQWMNKAEWEMWWATKELPESVRKRWLEQEIR
jgi:hypothetical protein